MKNSFENRSIKNNIIVDLTGGDFDMFLFWDSSGDENPALEIIKNNFLSRPSMYNLTEDNLYGDPMFVDPANFDFRLRPGSPCIDAGAYLPELETDFDGNPRGIDGDGRNDTGLEYDIGAFEYIPPGDAAARWGFRWFE